MEEIFMNGIAVIGMSFRFPNADNPKAFWENLKNGKESITFFSDEEMIDTLGEENIDLIKKDNYVKAAGILEDIENFDAHFFGYNPREAEIMDPQQRLFLTCAWEALEDSGYYKENNGERFGVFGGTSLSTYILSNLLSNVDLKAAPDKQMTYLQGNDKDYLCTRVSYKLNLKGPSVSVQSACSTSLVAVHLACQSLLSGECDLALAGGVTIKVPQKIGYLYQKGNILSPDGHCRAFDADAQGTVFGNGVGVIVLKPLDRAIEDGDNIYAVIRGTAVNNDGNLKVGYTAPSEEGQAAVITEAMAIGEVGAETIDYIEAHGTGTQLGDPIELQALKKVFEAETEQKNFCAIGSVKTNIGHLDRAAGIAGLIKVILSLKNKQIPPSLNFKRPNPQFDFSNSPFYVNTELTDWKKANNPRRAGVSSFGIGGTNAHIILEEAPKQVSLEPKDKWNILPFSAKTETALENATSSFSNYLKENIDINLADTAYTLMVGRKQFDCRRIVICKNSTEAVEALDTMDAKKVLTYINRKKERNIVFMFSGQGSQYVNMARDLYHNEPKFREVIDNCLETLSKYSNLDFTSILHPNQEEKEMQEKLNQTEITQPVIFMIEYALAKQLMNWGIMPDALIGHSIGEYAAACISGVISLKDALYLVTKRGELMQKVERGSMLSINLPEEEVKKYLAEDLSLALLNSDSLSVVSGQTQAINELAVRLKGEKIRHRVLHTSHAFHSHMMEPIVEEFTELVRTISVNQPKIPYISNVTGTWISVEDIQSPSYWARHLRSTIRFGDGIKELLKKADSIFVEVGPGNALCTFVKQSSPKTDGPLILSTLPHATSEENSWAYFLIAIGKLWLFGIEIDWFNFHGDEERRRLSLPKYQWDYQRFWVEPKGNTDFKMNSLKEKEIVSREEKSAKGKLHQRPNLLTPYKEPRNAIEEIIAEAWQELFKIDKIGIHDDFFDLGGHSLMATQLAARLNDAFGIEIPLQNIFQATTIAEIAQLIEDELSKAFGLENSEMFLEQICQMSASEE